MEPDDTDLLRPRFWTDGVYPDPRTRWPEPYVGDGLVHGTRWGARRHRQHGEKPCDKCREAERVDMQERRARKAA